VISAAVSPRSRCRRRPVRCSGDECSDLPYAGPLRWRLLTDQADPAD
jgi:hypothetical protein